MEDQKLQDVEKKEEELDLDELDQVAGGANPFANIGRVDNKKLDQGVRDNA